MGLDICIMNLKTGEDVTGWKEYRSSGDKEFRSLYIEVCQDVETKKRWYEYEVLGEKFIEYINDEIWSRPKDFNEIYEAVEKSNLPTKERYLSLVDVLRENKDVFIHFNQ